MRSLSVVGVWVFEFLADHLPSGSYPKTGVMSGLPTIRPEFDNRPLSGSLSALVCSHQLRTPGWIDSESRPIGSHPGSIALECQPPTELASEQREGRIRFADRVEAHLCCSQFSETSFCLRSGHRAHTERSSHVRTTSRRVSSSIEAKPSSSQRPGKRSLGKR